MKSKQVRTTQAHFEEFQKWCEYWRLEYGLASWIMAVKWERMSSRADCFCYPYNREFTIRFKRGLIPREDAENLKWLAFHEIGECLLWQLGAMAETGKKHGDDEVTAERHTILNTYETMVRRREETRG